MFTVEVTYRTRLGNLTAQMSTSQTVETMGEAEIVRTALKEGFKMSGIADADFSIKIKHAKPLPTFDEAMQKFREHFAEYPPLASEAITG